jgi:hypothetical protein
MLLSAAIAWDVLEAQHRSRNPRYAFAAQMAAFRQRENSSVLQKSVAANGLNYRKDRARSAALTSLQRSRLSERGRCADSNRLHQFVRQARIDEAAKFRKVNLPPATLRSYTTDSGIGPRSGEKSAAEGRTLFRRSKMHRGKSRLNFAMPQNLPKPSVNSMRTGPTIVRWAFVEVTDPPEKFETANN